MELESGNIVDRLRALATHLDDYPRGKIEDEILEAADVIERLRAQRRQHGPRATLSPASQRAVSRRRGEPKHRLRLASA